MPAIKYIIKDYGKLDIKNIKIEFIPDENSDLYYFINKKDVSYFSLLEKHSSPIKHRDYSFSTEFYLNDAVYKCQIPVIDFSGKNVTGETVVFGKDLEELVHNIGIKISENLIRWNEDYINSINNKNRLISFSNDLDKNNFLKDLYKNEINDEDLWFNKQIKLFDQQKLSDLKKIKEHLEKYSISLLDTPEIPSLDQIQYPKISFLDKLLKDDKKIIEIYHSDVAALKTKIELLNNRKQQIVDLNLTFLNKTKSFIVNIDEEIKTVEDQLNGSFKSQIIKYEEGENNTFFVENLLRYSILNSLYNFDFNVSEIKGAKHIVCEISLPNDKMIPNVKNYKSYKRDSRIDIVPYSDKEYKNVYNFILYSMVFRVLKEIYCSDYNNQIENITLNGWVNALNKKNGKYENRCILSLSITYEQFCEIDFTNVDIKEAFKHLKGVSSAVLIDFIPIAPIVSINKQDKRFIQSEEVLKNINDFTNIAAIDWEEFEHLVRELFEKEFAVNGGEVRVTQSSRDGGVDAIAFDPDPIRGGKIVIQSKRYTNVVGVSAIRDLYGTVMNEGAMKGIIITTSHYGSDAHEFAKGKPLTL